MLRPRTQRLRFAFARAHARGFFTPRSISLQFWHSSFRLSREHFRRTSRTAASQPSPRTQRLRFTFARLATRAQVIFCKAARAAAIALPPAPQRLCPTRQHLRLTPPSVNISRAFSQNRAIPRQNARHAARIPRIAPPRGIPRCVPSSRAISRHAPPACRFSRPHLLHYPFSMQKARRVSISRACKQRVFAMPRHFFACLPPGRSTLPATNHHRAQKSLRLSQIMSK